MARAQVRHKYTGQVMVMKEMKRASDEAKSTFLKEVSCCVEACSVSDDVRGMCTALSVGPTFEVTKPPQRPPVHWDTLQRRKDAQSHHRY